MKYKKLWQQIRTSISLILCLAMVLSLAGCKKGSEINENAENFVVGDSESAITQLAELGTEAGYENALAELTEKNTTQVDGDSYYRLQQNYQGIPVYGRTVVCATDEEGNVTSITGNVLDVDQALDLTPTVTQEQVETVVSAYLSDAQAFENVERVEIDQLGRENLCIYNLDNEECRLAYNVNVDSYVFLVDAHNGDILTVQETVQTVTGYLASDVNKQDGFDVLFMDGKYILEDSDRKISVCDLAGKSSAKIDNIKNSKTVSSTDEIFGNAKGEETCEDAVGLYRNVARLADYFGEVCPFDYAQIFVLYNDGADFGLNAYGGCYSLDEGKYYGEICLGKVTGVNDIDVLAHEYTHVISRKLVDWSGDNRETAAINEGISDIFGELGESAFFSLAPDWYMRGDNIDVKRNIADPKDTQNAANIGDNQWFAAKNGYYYSTVISHAAYLMWNGIDGDSAKKIGTDDLAKLWYRAMLMMPSDCDFATCRKLVEYAAKSMKTLTFMQRKCVGEAFDAVGIVNASDITVDYLLNQGGTLSVYDKDGNYYSGYTLKIEGQVGAAASDQFEYAMQYNNTTVVETEEPYPVILVRGYYTFTVSDKYSSDTYSFSVAVTRGNMQAKNNIELFTSYEALPIVEIPEETYSAEDVYRDVLDMYYTNISNHWSALDGKGWNDVYDPDSVSYLLSRYQSNSSLSEIGYAFVDLDNNGQPELLISSLDIAASGSFYDLYTVINGEIVHLVSAGERDTYRLAEDNTVNNEGSSGAAFSSFINYKLSTEEGKLCVKQGIIYDGSRDSQNPWFYADTEFFDEYTYELNYDVLTHISENEAISFKNSFPQNKPLVLTPFSDIHNAENEQPEALVSDAFYNGFPRSDGRAFYNYHIPKLNLPVSGAAETNAVIYENLYNDLYMKKVNGQENEPGLYGMTYNWSVNQNVISILTAWCGLTEADSGYKVYNISKKTGSIISTAELLSIYGLDENSFYGLVKEKLETACVQVIGARDNYSGNTEMLRFYDERLQKSISEENVHQAVPYIDANGDLCVVAGIYCMAGSGYFEDLVNITGDAAPQKPEFCWDEQEKTVTEEPGAGTFLSEEDAKALAAAYWGINEGDTDDETGFPFAFETQGRPTDTSPEYIIALRWYVDNDHWSTVDYVAVNAYTGECKYPY